jgi:O-antigen ligase
LTQLVAVLVMIALGWVAFDGRGASEAGPKAFSFFVYAIFFVIIRGSVCSEAALLRLLKAIGVAAIFGVALGGLHIVTGKYFFGAETTFEQTTTGSTRWLGGDHSMYGVFAALVIGMRVIVERKLDRFSAVILAAAVGEVVLAQHRTGFIALGAALFLTTPILAGSAVAAKGLLRLVLIAAIGLAVAWNFAGTYLDETVLRVGQSTNLDDANIAWRLNHWSEVFDGVLEQPWGHGFATWNFSFTWKDPAMGSHNSFLDLAYRIGLPGLLALLALPVVLMTRARRLIQSSDVRQHTTLLTSCACLLAFLVFAAFNVVFETPYVSIFFWVLMGIGAASLDRGKERELEQPR